MALLAPLLTSLGLWYHLGLGREGSASQFTQVVGRIQFFAAAEPRASVSSWLMAATAFSSYSCPLFLAMWDSPTRQISRLRVARELTTPARCVLRSCKCAVVYTWPRTSVTSAIFCWLAASHGFSLTREDHGRA